MKEISPNLFEFSYTLDLVFPLAGNTVTDVELRFDADSFFVLEALSAVRTGPFVVTFRDQLGNTFMNLPIQDSILFGNAQLPRKLLTKQVFEPMQSLFFTAIDGGTAAAYPHRVQLKLKGYKHLDLGRPPKISTIDPMTGAEMARPELFYTFAANAALLASEGPKPFPIQITNGYTFIVHSIDAYSSLGAAGGLDDFDSLVSDTGSKRDWSRNFVRRDNICGTAIFPGWLYQRKMVPGNTVLTVQLTNRSAILPNAIQFALVGGKRPDLSVATMQPTMVLNRPTVPRPR